MFKEFTQKATKVIDSIKPNISILKSKDDSAEYCAALDAFNSISYDANRMIGLIIKFQAQLEKISRTSVDFGESMDKWFFDAPEASQHRAKTVLSFAKNLDALTVNFLKPRTEPHVISALLKFQSEIDRLRELHDERQQAKKAMDKISAMLLVTIDKDKKQKLENQHSTEKARFDEKTTDFQQSVQVLSQNKTEALERPFRNLICLYSQFMMQIFTELQKFRTTFPPETFSILNEPPAQENPYQQLAAEQNM